MSNNRIRDLEASEMGNQTQKTQPSFPCLGPSSLCRFTCPHLAYPVEKRSVFPRDYLSTPKHNFGQKQVTRSLLWLVQGGRGLKEKWEGEAFHQRRGWRSCGNNTIATTDECTQPLHFLARSRHPLP